MKYSAFKQKVRTFPVFSTSQLSAVTDKVETLKVQLSLWKKRGLVRSLRQGLYVLSPEERRVEPSPFYLANQIFMPSYVSLESALAAHGLIPEFVAPTTSVTTRKTCRFENEFGLFTYQHVLPKAYGGFDAIREGEKFSMLIASPEKAVVDFLYFNLSQFHPSKGSIFTESYRFQNCEDLDRKKLRAFAKRFGTQKLFLVVELFIKEVLR